LAGSPAGGVRFPGERNRIKGLMSNPHNGFYLVVEVEGCIVASLMITTEWSDWRNGLFWWVQSVYVVAEWRRKGLYSKLYEEVKAQAQQHDDVCGYRLYVEHDNNVAQQAYQYLGMEETRYKLFEEMDTSVRYKK